MDDRIVAPAPDGYRPLFQKGASPLAEETVYDRLDIDGVETLDLGGRRFVHVRPEALTALAEHAFRDISHLLRSSHLQQMRSILDDPEATANDRFVALELLKNAVIAAEGTFPMCQDTGTAIITAKKGQQVLVEGAADGPVDEAALSAGVAQVYTGSYLRYSQMAPLSMFEEKNTRTNLPAQIDIAAAPGGAYEFLFIAKGGGSANKSFLFQETPRTLHPERLKTFLKEKIGGLGTAACPPYHLAIVVGGLSAELTLKTVKMASARYLDDLPTSGDDTARAFRDLAMEEEVLAITRELGIGAQFGGRYFCHDVRVIRLPRHGASMPIAIGVSCSADRQARAKITADGVFLERLERDPSRFLPETSIDIGAAVPVDLTLPMDEIRAILTRHGVGTPLLLNGPMIVARDLVHAALAERRAKGEPLPAYMRDHPIYYAGPAKTPDGFASGSFGPTTAARMDAYVPEFQTEGFSLVTLAKGNRSPGVVKSCSENGGFYLATIGGAAARVGRDMITHVEAIDFQDFGMEAVWRIEVNDFPAFIVTDDKGNDFFTVKRG